jgi:hypothetical protein
VNSESRSFAFLFWWHFGGTFVVAVRGMNPVELTAFRISARHPPTTSALLLTEGLALPRFEAMVRL